MIILVKEAKLLTLKLIFNEKIVVN